MAHDVFVSYPHSDKATADAAVNALESSRIRCWIAPRDVPKGADWAGAIVDAIERSRLLVLVFSDATNASDHILREVRAAGDAGIPILPFRTTEAEPNSALRYYIGGTHWLDALTRPLEEHLEELATSVSELLTDDGGQGDPGTGPEISVPVGATAQSGWWNRIPMAAKAGGAAGIAALVILVAVFAFGGGSDDAATSETATAPPDDAAEVAESEPEPGARAAEPEPEPQAAEPEPEPETPATEPIPPETEVPVEVAPSEQPPAFAFVLANREGPNPVCSVKDDGEVLCELVDGDQWSEDVAVADFDGDGRADLAFANALEYAGDKSLADVPSLARNRLCLAADGGWACSDISPDELHSEAIAAADLDGDGNQDVVVGNTFFEGPKGLFPEFVEVCLGDGGGGFACSPLGNEYIDSQATPTPVQIATADANLDGHLDIAIAMHNWPNVLCIGDGAGDFGCSDVEDETAFTTGVAVGDFAGSPGLDLVFTNYGTPNRLCVQSPDGGFACSDVSPPGYPNNAVAAFGDTGGDGYLDFIVGRWDGNSSTEREDENVDQICRTDGEGAVSCSPVEDPDSFTFAILVSDLDENGDADYLRVGGGVAACLGNGVFTCSRIDLSLPKDDRGFSLPLQDVGGALLP